MKTLTAEEFKDLLKTTHQAKNVKVTQPVVFDYHDTGTIDGDIEIRNCDLKSFSIAQNELTSLSFIRGKVKDLTLETGSVIQRVLLNKCDINNLLIVETNYNEFEFINGNIKTNITSRTPGLGDATFKGKFKDIRLQDLGATAVQMVNFEANNIEMLAPRFQSLLLKNFTVKQFNIEYPTGIPDAVTLEFENLQSKDLKIISRGERVMEFKGDTKYFKLGDVE